MPPPPKRSFRQCALLAFFVVAAANPSPLLLRGEQDAPANYASASLTLLDEPGPAPKTNVDHLPTNPSDPLAQWTMVSSGETTEYFTVRWLNQQFVALGARVIMTSPDGITWQNTAGNLSNSFFDVAGNDNPASPVFVAVGLNGTIATSPDLKKWKARPSPTGVQMFSVFWYDNHFLALGNSGLSLTSPDGVQWTGMAKMWADSFRHGTVLGNNLIMASNEGISTSTDGLTWRRAVRSSNHMLDVAANGTLIVAVGGTPDNFRISTDSIVWTLSTLGNAEQLNAVTWTGNQFVAAGGNGTILNSPDGHSWSLRTLGGNYGIEGVAGHDSTFVAVTDTGQIFTNQIVASVARPEISFAPGPPGSVPKLELRCTTPEAKLYYTENGAAPNARATPYTGPFSPTHSELINVRAYKDGLAPSAVASAQFTIPSP